MWCCSNIIASRGSYDHEDELFITDCHNSAHHGDDDMLKANDAHYQPIAKEDIGEDTISSVVKGEKLNTSESSLFNATFLYFAAIGFFASFGETSMTTWTVIYFKRFFDISTFHASIGFGVFMVFMALGRFAGDTLREWYGRRTLMHWCGACLIVGFTVLLYSPSLPFPGSTAAYFGYFGSLLIGSGLSVLIPTVFSSAGHLPGVHAGSAIACAAAITYAGSIISPMFLGLCSQLFGSLRYAFLLDGVLLSAIFVLSFKIPGEVSKWFSTKTEEPLLGEQTYSDDN